MGKMGPLETNADDGQVGTRKEGWFLYRFRLVGRKRSEGEYAFKVKVGLLFTPIILGIASHHGRNPEETLTLNPHTVLSLQKGRSVIRGISRVFY